MSSDRREQIRSSLTVLAQSQQATMAILERTMSLLYEELSLEPVTSAHNRSSPNANLRPIVNSARLTVSFHGKACFLGNTLPFRFIARLLQRPNCYFTYDELLSDVWEGCCRSDASVRSVVKVLRRKLRESGMDVLADSIDGSVPGRYALKLHT